MLEKLACLLNLCDIESIRLRCDTDPTVRAGHLEIQINIEETIICISYSNKSHM